MKTYMRKDKLWNIFFFIWKMVWYAIGAILLFRLLQVNWLVFMLVCIIIVILNPKYFKN